MAKKKTLADRMEEGMRKGQLPAELHALLVQVIQIELNAKWAVTEEGKSQLMHDNGYDEVQLSHVLEKQEEHRQELLLKVNFIKRLINESK